MWINTGTIGAKPHPILLVEHLSGPFMFVREDQSNPLIPAKKCSFSGEKTADLTLL